MRCETCHKDGRLSTYAGETGRNGYSRGKEHLDALRLEDEENPLWKHCLIEHGGVKAEFSMKVVGRFYSCLVRQVNEAVRIFMSEADCVMNSKSEFHQSPLVRVVAVTGLLEEQGDELDLVQEGRRRGQAGGEEARVGADAPGAVVGAGRGDGPAAGGGRGGGVGGEGEGKGGGARGGGDGSDGE